MTPLKFQVATLGCRTNQYETQAFQDQLLAMGHIPVQEGERADLCIVNTCTVTESADSSSRHTIRSLHRKNPGAKIVVTGCYAEREREKVLEIEGVTHVISNKDKQELLSIVFPDEEIPEFSIKHFDAHTRAFVKVQDGCNSFCTYCIIPYVRGRSRSRGVDEIVKEVEGLVSNGYKEVVLTGINVGDFDGGDGTVTLADLVKRVDLVDGLKRLRISSIDPDEVNEDLMTAVLGGKTTCPSMHIVLQSGSNVILKRMNRKYTRQIFLQTVERLKKVHPDFTFTTDVIVGFPGETEKDHEETLQVISEVVFTKVHMFPYSDRARTRAATYPNKVPVDVMKRRKLEVMQEFERTAFKGRELYVGRVMEVLTEAVNEEDFISGHTMNFLEVLLPRGSLGPNELVQVKLIENTPDGFRACLV